MLTKTNDMLPTISNAIDSSSDFLNNSKSVLDDTQGKLSDISPTVKQDLIKSENVLDNSSVELKNLDENVLPEISKKVLLNVRILLLQQKRRLIMLNINLEI